MANQNPCVHCLLAMEVKELLYLLSMEMMRRQRLLNRTLSSTIGSSLVHSMVFTMGLIANFTMVFSTCLRLAEIPEKNTSRQKELEIAVDEGTFPYKLYILSLILI